MKTVLRIIIILGAALVVSGGALLIVNTGGTGTTQFPGGGEGRRLEGEYHVPGQGMFPKGSGQGNGLKVGHSEENNGTIPWAVTLKNIAIIAGIVLAVALIERLLRTVRRKKTIPASQEEPGRKDEPIE
jgi:hypothetical protein